MVHLMMYLKASWMQLRPLQATKDGEADLDEQPILLVNINTIETIEE